MTISDLYINNVKMPTPALEGVTLKYEPIWSANTGRTSSGKMVGTVVATKTTLSIKWAALSYADAAKIVSALKGTSFVPVRFTDLSGATKTLTMYGSAPSITQYSWATKAQWVKNVSVELIEQ